MSVVNSVVALLFVQTVIILQRSQSVYGAVPPLQCGEEQCQSGSDCRPVVSCPSCPVQPRCVPTAKFGPGVDRACLYQGISEVILVEDAHNVDHLNRLQCSVSGDCPYGSTCVDAASGQRVCCQGQQLQQPQQRSAEIKKPGTCPTFDGVLCSGMFCSTDNDCPGKQLCCNGCVNVCADPVQSG